MAVTVGGKLTYKGRGSSGEIGLAAISFSFAQGAFVCGRGFLFLFVFFFLVLSILSIDFESFYFLTF